LGLLWLALIAWVPIAAFRTWFGILVFAILFAVFAVIFRREAIAEHPDAERQSLGKTMRTLRASITGPPPPPAPSSDPVAELERLNALRADGALTPEEFEAAKRKILAAP